MSRERDLEKAAALMSRLGAHAVHWQFEDGIEVGDNTNLTNPELTDDDERFCVTTGQDDGNEEFCGVDELPEAVRKVRAARARSEYGPHG